MYVVIYSGGMDSYTLLHRVIRMSRQFGYGSFEDVVAMSFHYGQRHKKELGYARDECARLGIRHHVADLRDVGALLRGSSLTDPGVPTPHGHYAAENMKKTVVPGRNTIMLSVAMGFAESLPARDSLLGYNVVYYGAHAGDHHIYPDCRPGFVTAMKGVFHEATEGKVHLEAPFLRKSKGEILAAGLEDAAQNGYTLDYGNTWTCYEGGDHPCGKCGACVERAEAFAFAGVDDPLITRMGVK